MTTMAPRKGKYQNLAKGHCPYDDAKLERDGKVYACPNCDYYITPKKMVEYLTNPKSYARLNLSAEERKRIDKTLGIP